MEYPREFCFLVGGEDVDGRCGGEESFCLVRFSLEPCAVQHNEDAEDADDES